MSDEAVNIYVKDTGVGTLPIEGVSVAVYNQAGSELITRASTDADGLAALLLPSGVTYQLRMYKNRVVFGNPMYITVMDALGTNNFDISGEVFTPPVATDSRLCMASGYFKTPSGGPAKFKTLHVIAKFDPALVDGNAYINERIATRTDENGYVQLPLVRFAKYLVTIEGFEDYSTEIRVPDQASVNLPDLLFPVVGYVDLVPAGPYTVAVGEDLAITPTVRATDGEVLYGVAGSDVIWAVSDDTKVYVAPEGLTVTLRGRASGTCTLTCTRRDLSIVRIPDTGIQFSSSVDITVTP